MFTLGEDIHMMVGMEDLNQVAHHHVKDECGEGSPWQAPTLRNSSIGWKLPEFASAELWE